jgi:hypothetical protein
VRDARWSEAVVVGSLAFVEKVKSELGINALHRNLEQLDEVPKSRFDPKSNYSRGKTSRDPLIAQAIKDYGYSQMEVASFLDLHYSTISRIVADVGKQQK